MATVRATTCAMRAAMRSQRSLHSSCLRRAITNLEMPAMSPTMTEGSIANWKKKEGDSFSAGDVLLEIETDKATIDVEAQDDGVMGKIIIPDGTKNVKVGKVIALLAEEGDDISNLEIPPEKESSPSSSASSPQSQPEAAASKQEASASTSESSPTSSASASVPSSSTNGHHATHPTHSRPLFPSVYRLLVENGIAKADKIKGTGIRGMLTKGDVLAYLGKASSPTGTFKEAAKKEEAVSPAAKKPPPKVYTLPELRQIVVQDLLKTSNASRVGPPPKASTYDDIINEYWSPLHPPKPAVPTPSKEELIQASAITKSKKAAAVDPLLTTKKSPAESYLEGLF